MKTPNFPLGDKELKIGMLGFSEGNAHPFSWSAMFNGYDKDEMNKWCAKDYPAIPNYLGKQPAHTLGIPGAKITHICFTGDEDRTMAEGCAKATFIPNVCDRPEEMIGQVDAVICATDKGFEHVERVRPFIEAGIPLFIDKPMTDNEEDLRTLVKWHDEGAKFISSSSMRYTKELEPYIQNRYEIGPLRYILSPMAKYWENYGIHALERIFPLIGQALSGWKTWAPRSAAWSTCTTRTVSTWICPWAEWPPPVRWCAVSTPPRSSPLPTPTTPSRSSWTSS